MEYSAVYPSKGGPLNILKIQNLFLNQHSNSFNLLILEIVMLNLVLKLQ